MNHTNNSATITITATAATTVYKKKRRPSQSQQQQQQPISAKDCWFVIGAHLAGSSERECSQLSGLSKTITHNIIANFKKLGSPHPTKLSVTEMFNSRNNIQSGITVDQDTKKKKRKMTDVDAEGKDALPRKRGRPRNPPEAPFFTRAIVEQALKEARDTPYTTTTIQNDRSKVQWTETPIETAYPLDRLDTPPRDGNQQLMKGLERPSLSPSEFFIKGSGNASSLPLTPRSHTSTPSPSLDGDDEDEEAPCSSEPTIEKDWTLEDDKEILLHVLGLPLTKNIKWKEVEKQFGNRHVARMCSERWAYIKKQLINDIIQSTST
ncbi:hypothetical protein BDF20DRAFT_132655 [Mycotypha africana]|uniref:uncharacterized protein n=1 Tax=Mycotypha africana TaxID=64632 RepID=UPI0023012F26|nr:uncharacterized protein BDF20DRAFT_132655 [Mycotypha africana]KAI8968914.1 hypothetical protein BDF20DRAFT_132655 [Mycotypha africana]